MPLMPVDVRNKQFATTRLRPGYDEEEVDTFLDEVEAEMERLLQENQELRARLAGYPGGGTPAAPAPGSALTEPDPQSLAAEPVLPEPQRPPVPALMGMPGQEPSMDTVARVLVLAQQTADQALADARREPARHWAGRAGRPMRSLARPAARRSRSPVMPGPWPRACSATRRSGTTRPWARWCRTARNSSGGSVTCAPSNAIAAAG